MDSYRPNMGRMLIVARSHLAGERGGRVLEVRRARLCYSARLASASAFTHLRSAERVVARDAARDASPEIKCVFEDEPCGAPVPGSSLTSTTPGRQSQIVTGLALAAGLLFIQDVMFPLVACANESAPEGTFEMILKTTDALGPLGGAFFVLSVVLCECIPLFPTTPLSLASGILFGPQKGALLILGGTTIASVIAFSISRGFGRPIAERIISAEMASHDEEDGPSIIQQKLQEMEGVIERGSFWQQAGSVLAMRLTPVIPFSASNYLLGLTPLPIAPYLTGTLVGMSFWSVVYASLGGASRSVLRAGVDPDQLLAELLETTGIVTSKAGVAAFLGVVIVGAVYFGKGLLADKEASKRQVSRNAFAATKDAEASAAEDDEEDDSIVSKLHLPAADVGFYGEKLEQ